MYRAPWVLLTFALILPGDGLVGQVPDGGGLSTFVGVHFPDEAAGFHVTQATRYPDPSLGIGLTYGSERARMDITVYVYPVSPGEPEDLAGAEFDRGWQELQEYTASQREGVELELGDVEPWEVTTPDGTRFAGRRGEGTLRMGATALSTWLYVFVKGDSYIKYRVTLERASRRLLAPDLEAFVARTLERIEGPARP